MVYSIAQNHVLDIFFFAAKSSPDPFNLLEFDLLVKSPSGREMVVPGFWAGGRQWCVRFSSPETGVHTFTSRCTDLEDSGLQGIVGEIEVSQGSGETNALIVHGGIRIRSDRRGFAHADGSPFLWLGDTWWMALGGRLGWPEDFLRLTEDRRRKGFSVVHVVAGLFPDMPVDSPRNSNAGGPSWEAGFQRINPAFFDHADLKIRHLVSQGIVPLVVGCWGYYLPALGMEKMRQHWRYLIARWAAYPVIWCLAGEATMPYYLSDHAEEDVRLQREGWTKIGQYVREIDPYQRLITAHSCSLAGSEDELADAGCLDFNFPQTLHGNINAAARGAQHIANVAKSSWLQPVVNSETCYEGILGTAFEDVQRFSFWSTMLSGAAGYSYGANGIWQVNQNNDPYGPSPHGMAWGNRAWDEAMNLPGSAQLGLGAGLLRELGHERFKAHPEWITPHADAKDWFAPYCAGIEGEVRVVYFPQALAPWTGSRPRMQTMAAGWQSFYFDPATGMRQDTGLTMPDADGSWEVPQPSLGADMVLVVKKM